MNQRDPDYRTEIIVLTGLLEKAKHNIKAYCEELDENWEILVERTSELARKEECLQREKSINVGLATVIVRSSSLSLAIRSPGMILSTDSHPGSHMQPTITPTNSLPLCEPQLLKLVIKLPRKPLYTNLDMTTNTSAMEGVTFAGLSNTEYLGRRLAGIGARRSPIHANKRRRRTCRRNGEDNQGDMDSRTEVAGLSGCLWTVGTRCEDVRVHIEHPAHYAHLNDGDDDGGGAENQHVSLDIKRIPLLHLFVARRNLEQKSIERP
ncbi:hypothetical protein Y032_0035g3005 [Ancylostoma ceylanicum]|uniref:Uncharacterized protein n=1 Tax=Ancylostoma ceylanicum TaxID=53326 RepID=A0A016UMX8_9BILA|nr:hypothetical protein Y032_0035g3005 [Ancylostoma ceylanicum]